MTFNSPTYPQSVSDESEHGLFSQAMSLIVGGASEVMEAAKCGVMPCHALDSFISSYIVLQAIAFSAPLSLIDSGVITQDDYARVDEFMRMSCSQQSIFPGVEISVSPFDVMGVPVLL